MKAAPALLATSPPTHPFADRDASGFPNRELVTPAVASAAAAEHRMVLAAISTTRPGSTFANNRAPANSGRANR